MTETMTGDRVWLGPTTRESVTIEVRSHHGAGLGLRVDRAGVVSLRDELTEYLRKTPELEPAALFYSSKIGWSWSSEELASANFDTEEEARKDMESAGHYMEGKF